MLAMEAVAAKATATMGTLVAKEAVEGRWRVVVSTWLRCLVVGGDTRVKRSLRGRQLARNRRPMPKVYAYLRRVPIQKQYVVSYPYGVGGATLLDQLANTVTHNTATRGDMIVHTQHS